jgi:hypothetical protein
MAEEAGGWMAGGGARRGRPGEHGQQRWQRAADDSVPWQGYIEKRKERSWDVWIVPLWGHTITALTNHIFTI